jgi:histidyl-tRNA synthetase
MGFGSGLERVILEMQKNDVELGIRPAADVFIVHRTEGAQPVVFGLARSIRNEGLAVVVGESGRSFKSQLRSADASGAALAVIIGDDELAAGSGVIKDLRAGGEQESVPVAELPADLARRFRPA